MAFDGGRLAPGAARDWCGTMPVHRRLLDSDPGYARARAKIETFTFDATREEPPPLGLVTIPIVVHVVWPRGAEHRRRQVATQSRRSTATTASEPRPAGVPAPWGPMAAAQNRVPAGDHTRTPIRW